jgi:PadR family transcriptional regulator PadR
MIIFGRFELVVMAVLFGLSAEDSHSVKIGEGVRERTGRYPSAGALHTTLGRLVKRELLSTSLSGPSPIRGGKRRRLYTIEPAGLRALEENIQWTEDLIKIKEKFGKGGAPNGLSPQTIPTG